MQLVLFVCRHGRLHQRLRTVFEVFWVVFLPCFWISPFLSKECAKCIVKIVSVVLILCLTFAKHKSDTGSDKDSNRSTFLPRPPWAGHYTRICCPSHCVLTFSMLHLCPSPIIDFAFFVKSPPVIFFYLIFFKNKLSKYMQ